jgi:flagellar motility protein MotE (MotC chaperone)
MKRSARLCRVFAMFAAVVALAAPGRAQQVPAWGWKPDEVPHYQELMRPKKPEAPGAWNAATVGAPPAAAAPGAPGAGEAKPPPPLEITPAIKAYCQNIEDAALEVRFLHQKRELQRLEGELEKRTAALEAKRAEYQTWLQRRDEFINKAEGSLVALYAKIKPEAAATQLTGIDEEAAAALLLKLSPRSASAILDQMDSAKAARLVSVMIGAAKRPEKAANETASAETPPAPQKAPGPEAAAASPEAGKEQAAQPPQTAEKKL